MAARTKFYLDKEHAKFKGVCAGIADYTGFDITWVRVAALVLAVTTHLLAIGAYFAVAWIAEDKPRGLYSNADDAHFWQGVRANPGRSSSELRSKLRDIDRRLAGIETLYTSNSARLASEIDSLR